MYVILSLFFYESLDQFKFLQAIFNAQIISPLTEKQLRPVGRWNGYTVGSFMLSPFSQKQK